MSKQDRNKLVTNEMCLHILVGWTRCRKRRF